MTCATGDTAVKDLVVVGAGASGLVCTLAAVRLGLDLLLLEKTDRCGSKLALTGGAKANLTHVGSPRELARRFDCSPSRLVPLLRRFPYQRIIALFEGLGISCRVDDDGCVWPIGLGAPGVRNRLVEAVRAAGVEPVTGARVTGITIHDGLWSAKGSFRTALGRNLCVATGGASHPGTGSSGDGAGLCADLGVRTTAWYPALCSLAPEVDVSSLAGITQQRVGLNLTAEGRSLRKTEGHFIFAHRYVSGSAVLNLSGHAARELAAGSGVVLTVNWLTDSGAGDLEREIEAARRRHGRRRLVNWLVRHVSRRLGDWLLRQADIPTDRLVADLTGAERDRLTQWLKQTRFRIVGTEPIERATVTGGGVVLDEVDLATCAVGRMPGLYVTGELLDTWAETGGYNLHLAWATGIAVAESIAGRELK